MNERIPYDSCELAFKFLVRNVFVRGRKFEGFDASDKDVLIVLLISLGSTSDLSHFLSRLFRSTPEDLA